MADSFRTKLRPISLQLPKVLMPVVNVPMLDYTLECLSSNKVQIVYIMCCAHAQLIEKHLAAHWSNQNEMAVHVVLTEESYSAGDALRHLDRLQLIEDDFILLSGDVVGNLRLEKALKAHKDRVKQDKRNVMTVVMKKAAQAHATRSLEDDLVVCLHKPTQQLLIYHDEVEDDEVVVERDLFADFPNMHFRYDLMDTHIDICSPELLMLFTDNFDWADIRKDAIVGIIGSEILGNKIYVHEIDGAYAARCMDLRTYDSISRDIIHRWTFPLVPDNNLLGAGTDYSFHRHNIYKEGDVKIARSARLGPDTVVGAATTIADNTTIASSVIGRNCTIGANCHIQDSYIWAGVTIEADVVILRGIVCDGAVIKKGARLERGSVVSFGVHIGPGFLLKEHHLVTTVVENLELAGGGRRKLFEPSQRTDVSAVGEGGKGFAHALADEEYTVGRKTVLHRLANSVAPSAEALLLSQHSDDERVSEFEDDEEAREEEGAEELCAGEGVSLVGPLADSSVMENSAKFYDEVEEYLRGAEAEKKDLDGVVIEMMGLKLSANATSCDYGYACLMTWVKLAAEEHSTVGEDGRVKPTKAYVGAFLRLLKRWHMVVGKLASRGQDQLELLLGLERACSTQELKYSAIFPIALQQLYELDVFSEDSVFAWEKMRANATGAQQQLLRSGAPFLAWLHEAEDEGDEGEAD